MIADNFKLIPTLPSFSFMNHWSKVQQTAQDESQVQYKLFKPNQMGVKTYIKRWKCFAFTYGKINQWKAEERSEMFHRGRLSLMLMLT